MRTRSWKSVLGVLAVAWSSLSVNACRQSLLGADGNVYVVSTHGGGTYGQLVKLSLSWSGDVVTSTSSVLHGFGDTLYGSWPSAPVVEDANGNFFGTAAVGASSNKNGLVYEYSSSGTVSVIYQFQGGSTDACGPGFMTLKQGTADTVILYGEAAGCSGNSGAIFKLKGLPGTPTSWAMTILHEFTGSSTDGGGPAGGLLLATDGYLYGTTHNGGTWSDGGIFQESTSGGTPNHIYFFSSSESAGGGGLVERTSSDTMTLVGERNDGIGGTNDGEIYQITNVRGGSFTYSVVYSFSGGTLDGAYAQGNLIYSSVLGYFFGITNGGGSSGDGTFYSLTPSGSFSIVNNFSTNPISSLVWMSGSSCNPCVASVSANGGADSDGYVWIGIQP